METKTTGQALSDLRERAGISLAEVAKLAGYKGPSSVQMMFHPDYDAQPLNGSIAERLANALVGKGTPPIEQEDIFELARPKIRANRLRDHGRPAAGTRGGTDVEIEFRVPPAPSKSSADRFTLSKNATGQHIPVFGTVLAADLTFSDDGESPGVEQTVFEMGETITYARRPYGIAPDVKVYALYVSGSSMEPRYRAGDPLFVDAKRPPSIGDDVIVQLLRPAGDEQEIAAGLIKTLVKRTGSYLELEQYHPAIRFKVPMERVASIHRVIPLSELFGI